MYTAVYTAVYAHSCVQQCTVHTHNTAVHSAYTANTVPTMGYLAVYTAVYTAVLYSGVYSGYTVVIQWLSTTTAVGPAPKA